MAVLRSLVTTLGMNSAQYRADLKRAQKSAVDFGSKLKSVATAGAKSLKSISSAALNLKTAMVAIGTGAALYGIKQAYEHTDAIRRQGEMIGVSADEWARYTYAAGIVGVTTEGMADAFKDLGVRITDAAKTGAGTMVDFFTQINQSAADWAAMAPDEQFRRFAEELNKMSASDARFYLDEVNDGAFRLFSTLRNGELLRLTDEAEQLGLTLSSGQFEAISDTRKDLETLASTGVGVWQQVQAAAAPAISEVSKGILQWINDQAKAAGGFKNLGIVIAKTVLQAVVDTAKGLEKVLNLTYQGAEKLANMMGETLNPESATLTQELKMLQGEYNNMKNMIEGVVASEDAFFDNTLTPEQLARYELLPNMIDELKTKLATGMNFNFASQIDDQVNSIVASLESVDTNISPANAEIHGAKILDDGGGDDAAAAATALAKSEAEIERIRQQYATEQELLLEKTLIEQETLIAAEDAKLISEQESQALRKQSWDAYYSSVNKEAEDSANQQAQAQANANATMAQMQTQVMNQAVGLIKSTAEEGSAVWMAALIAEKGIAIAQAIIFSEVAAVRALAELGPIAGPPMAATIRTLGYASAALIAATGVAEIAGAKATGGPVASGKTYLVGEHGPELYTAGASGQITSNANLNKAMNDSGSAGVVVNINQLPADMSAEVEETEDDFGRKVIDVVLMDQRSGGEMTAGYQGMWGLNRKGQF